MIIILDTDTTRKIINLQYVTRTYLETVYGQLRLVILFANGDSDMLAGDDIESFFALVEKVAA